jgi:hypothetical protein
MSPIMIRSHTRWNSFSRGIAAGPLTAVDPTLGIRRLRFCPRTGQSLCKLWVNFSVLFEF